ncbi:MAG: PD-(D/E)XK nuclease family protein [Candidatus Omnitrophota bacterium]|nr:PD-(D/E)XK nuclease family protein [Candidatus Omnitrophota bacterium]MBU2528272.1 PD-(D/E)XK nuclease family protein [bacterium]MBU3929649.1 PD-(D/E)XK nuclease family protein [bacterium]MBU4122133.1 PD-(D/E)XK nuclease family protein [bacterium]
MAKITFTEEDHSYRDENGNDYISVTQLISQNFEPFDAETIADRVRRYRNSRYYGWTKDEVLTFWDKITQTGCEVHSSIENYIKHRKKPEDESMLAAVNQFSALNFKGELMSETIVHDEELLVAGTIDIIEKQSDRYVIWDIKTGRKMNSGKLEKYSIQLEFYRHMLSKMEDAPVEIGGIIWLEDFINKQTDTKLKIAKTLNAEEAARTLMTKRLQELRSCC